MKKEGKLYPLDTSKLERIPPYNIEAEESLLGSMLISRDAIVSVIEIVASEDFYRKSNQEVFNTIIELYIKGEPADPITVADQLNKKGLLDEVGGKTFIHSLKQYSSGGQCSVLCPDCKKSFYLKKIDLCCYRNSNNGL